MTRFWKFASAVVLGLVSVSAASAQTYGPMAGGYSTGTFFGGAPMLANHHSSTIDEGYMTGYSRVLQGAGIYNALSAEAYNRMQDGYAKELDNKQRYVKTYFETKRLNASYRAETMPAPLSKEKLDQWNLQDQPERLSRREYNSDTGSVQWPAVLQAQVFDGNRLLLEDLFARRTANEFGVNSPFYRQVNASTAQIKDQLKNYLRSEDRFFSHQEYVAAQNFLNSLTQEARLAPDLDGLAAN
ncbi:hypothetical protein ETAA8_66720 [Anatilimnocola aggregata]|uniref:Peptidylprolyl isomerase n=1 Tax=Anatilimnocola aggregata TaxID=2528021 RepID=A0A517YMS1_9BACT|nr:hypothetical protein [Anatilimnocola aggregata]QDU31513.1 hypothetical protein ETAA8_66720 [Anatilimnocola aggregata]